MSCKVHCNPWRSVTAQVTKRVSPYLWQKRKQNNSKNWYLFDIVETWIFRRNLWSSKTDKISISLTPLADTASKQNCFAGRAGGWETMQPSGLRGGMGKRIWKSTITIIQLLQWSASWNRDKSEVQQTGELGDLGYHDLELLFATTVTCVVRCFENKQLSGISAISLHCCMLVFYFRQVENRWRQLGLGVALQYSLCLRYKLIFQTEL